MRSPYLPHQECREGRGKALLGVGILVFAYLTLYAVLLTVLPGLIVGQEQKILVITTDPKPVPVVTDVRENFNKRANLKNGWLMRGHDNARGKTNLNNGTDWLVWELVNANDVLSDAKQFKRVKGAKNKVELIQDITDSGVKEIYILEAGADTILTYTLNTSYVPELQQDGGVLFGEIMLLAPWAIDANNDSVAVDVTLTGPVAGLYTLTYIVRAGTAQWPITLDPTASIGKSNAGHTWYGDETAGYTAVHNAATALSTGAAVPAISHQGNGPGSSWRQIHRYRAEFSLSGTGLDSSAITSAHFVVPWTWNHSDGAPALSFGPISSTASGALATTMHSKLKGWAASGSYSVLKYATFQAVSGGSGETGVFNFPLNSSGLDTVKTLIQNNGTFKVHFLDQTDIDFGDPGETSNSVSFTGAAVTLEIVYTGAPSGPIVDRAQGTTMYQVRGHEIDKDNRLQGSMTNEVWRKP